MDLRTKLSQTLSAIFVVVLFVSLGSSRTRLSGDSTPAGTLISNRAEATYEGEDGAKYGTVSETVSFTVVAVATLTVAPKETAPSASVVPGERIARLEEQMEAAVPYL